MQHMDNDSLREALALWDLPVTGTKRVLVDRLKSAVQQGREGAATAGVGEVDDKHDPEAVCEKAPARALRITSQLSCMSPPRRTQGSQRCRPRRSRPWTRQATSPPPTPPPPRRGEKGGSRQGERLTGP